MGAAIPFIIAGATGTAGSIMQAKAIKNQAKYEEAQAKFNSDMAELGAMDATKRGDKNANEIRKNAKRVKGAQRSGFASQGVLVDSGSSADIIGDTKYLSEQDIMVAKNNAWREAFGFRVQANNYRVQGMMAMSEAKNKINSTLLAGGLGGGSSFLKAYGQYKNGGK